MTDTPDILYLTHTRTSAEAVQNRYPRGNVRCAPLTSVMGRRGHVVVVEPLPPGADERTLKRFHQLVEDARMCVRELGNPIVIGELV